jgi:HSP20 family molecular chaperone IbpA
MNDLFTDDTPMGARGHYYEGPYSMDTFLEALRMVGAPQYKKTDCDLVKADPKEIKGGPHRSEIGANMPYRIGYLKDSAVTLIELACWGVTKEQVAVELYQGNMLSVSWQMPEPNPIQLNEFGAETKSFQIRLPERFSDLKVKLEHGILQITFKVENGGTKVVVE